MQPLDPTIKSTWLAPTQTAITKGNAKLLQDNLADDATLADQLKTWQQEINSDLEPTVQEPLKKAFALWMKDAEIPTSIQTILAKDPTAKVPSYITGYLALDPKDPTSVASYKTQLTKEFGGLKNNKGESLINTDLIDAVASGSADFNDLGNQIITAVQTATNKSLGSSASQFSDITDSPTYKNLLSDPSKLADAYNANVSKLKQNATTGLWEVGTSGGSGSDITGASGSAVGPNGEYQYNGGINQLLNKEGDIDPTLLNQVLTAQQKNVNANKWHAPVYDPATGKYVSNTSPYSAGLTNMLNGYQTTGDFYSPGYVNSLANKQPAAMSSEGIASLKSTFTDPKTSTDLLNLANSVGTDYANGKNPITAGSKLSPTLIKQYQPSTITNAAGKTSPAAKPGAPDLSNTVVPTTTIPAIDTKIPLTQIKDTSTAIPEWKRLGYTSEAAYADDIAKKAAADAKRIADEKAAADEKARLDAKRIADEKAIADETAYYKKSLLSNYNFNNYISPETRAALANNSDFFKSISSTTPDLKRQIEYSNLLDSLSGNTGTTTTAGSLQGASNVANANNPITSTATSTIDPRLLSEQKRVIDFINSNANNTSVATQLANAKSYLESINYDIARVDPTKVVSAGNGIATNTSGFTSASNMNTNATGSNGAAGITSVLPNTSNTFSIPGNTFSLPAVPTNTSGAVNTPSNTLNITNAQQPVNNTPQTIDLSGAVNNPAVLNITNAQQQPVNNTPNYATGLTLNASPVYGAPALQENPTPGGIDKAWLSQNASNVQNLINATPATDTARLDQLNNVLAGYNADLNR